eukprot:TRINITY_DN4184_c0_g1_i1.p1 TRINITY_DN4184_c0_g1~~TRINITY_DN4184_c0_g1_i1.p1  ORF type:complete len:997 (+),score=107.50 TRINITY_DN4184_c0_g1_i1:176-3166(+)
MADSVIPELVSRGRIKAAEVLAVVDRRAFVPKPLWNKIHVDQPLLIPSVQTWMDSIMHMATLIEALDVRKGNSVLDIGCGCGHLTAITGYLAGKTGFAIGIDFNAAVIKYAQECLGRLDVKLDNVAYFPMNVYFMDKKVKFDRIVVGVACSSTYLRSIISQLNVSGVLVTPMPDGKLYQIRRINDDEWTKEVIGSHKASPMAMPQTTDEMVKGADTADSSLDAMKKWISSRKAISKSLSSLSSTGSSGSAGSPTSFLVHSSSSTDSLAAQSSLASTTPFAPPSTTAGGSSSVPASTGGGQNTSGPASTSSAVSLDGTQSLVSSGGGTAPLSMSGSGGIHHSGGKGAVQYYCDKCRARIPSGGIRWRCDDCGDLDLCEACFDAGPPFPEPHDYFLHSNLVAFSTGRDANPIEPSSLSPLQCASCSRYILGLRWHCAICSKFDLCAACQAAGTMPSHGLNTSKGSKRHSQSAHTFDHPMIPFQEPGHRRLNLSSSRLPGPSVPVTPAPVSPAAGAQKRSPAPSSTQQGHLDHSNLRSIVNQSANELLERLKLYDVHGVSPFASPTAAPAPSATTATSPVQRPQSPPTVKPMFNASLYTAGSPAYKSGTGAPRMNATAKGLLSGSSEDEKEDQAHGEHSLRRSTQIARGDYAEDKPAAPAKPEPGVPSNFVITYFGDEVGPTQSPSEHVVHPMSSSLLVSQSSILQTSGSQSSLSPLLSTSSVGVDVPIIKWSELEVGELLGSGAFGTVHAGRWRGAPVAIKRLHVAPDNPMEFMHEAAMMRKMSHHPNIIRLFGICDDPTNFAIISQLCSNGSLHDILSKRPVGEIPWHRIVGIARDAAAGAYHLHCENLIHRDLACRNILVTENWTGVISDFGLSRVLENQNKSHRTATMSAVRWAAPECLKDEKYSSKSDVWSFGMCLVEILTRGPPFPNLSYAEILRAVYTDRTLPIELPVDSDVVLRDLVSSCCKQNPDDRIEFKDIYAILDKHYKALVANSNK